MRAHEIANTAATLVGGDRDKTHGDKRENFQNCADLWTAWIQLRFPGCEVQLEAVDFGAMMVLVKLARTQTGTINLDDYVDMCGYAACMGEIALEEPPV